MLAARLFCLQRRHGAWTRRTDGENVLGCSEAVLEGARKRLQLQAQTQVQGKRTETTVRKQRSKQTGKGPIPAGVSHLALPADMAHRLGGWRRKPAFLSLQVNSPALFGLARCSYPPPSPTHRPVPLSLSLSGPLATTDFLSCAHPTTLTEGRDR